MREEVSKVSMIMSIKRLGTYIQRKRIYTKYSDIELSKLSPKHNARKNPEMLVERWVIDEIKLPPLFKVQNRVDVIIFGKDPIY